MAAEVTRGSTPPSAERPPQDVLIIAKSGNKGLWVRLHYPFTRTILLAAAPGRSPDADVENKHPPLPGFIGGPDLSTLGPPTDRSR